VSTACAKTTDAAWLPSARLLSAERLHLHYGPIDLLIDVDASSANVRQAHRAAQLAFDGVLESLVAELPLLKSPIHHDAQAPKSCVGQRMWAACRPHADVYVTPMEAVAGAVADHIRVAITRAVPNVNRVWVNNGGYISLWLAKGQSTQIAVCGSTGNRAARMCLKACDGVGGVATSGWAGRSLSLGIADAVTVLATTAAQADVAATLIANAVQLSDQSAIAEWVTLKPANAMQNESDLGNQLVTTAVAPLSTTYLNDALHNGLQAAKHVNSVAPFHAVFIECQGHSVSMGDQL